MSEEVIRLNSVLSERYRIERRLAARGMATVDLAHDCKGEASVVKPTLAAELGAERIVIEIRPAAARLHPNGLRLFMHRMKRRRSSRMRDA